MISESGNVEGEVFAKELIVNGMLEGTCHAESVLILSKGQVNGKICTNNLSIEQGGKFFGETAQLPKEEAVELNTKNKDIDIEKKKKEPGLKTA